MKKAEYFSRLISLMGQRINRALDAARSPSYKKSNKAAAHCSGFVALNKYINSMKALKALCVIYSVGLVFHLPPQTRGYMFSLTPLVLFGTFALVIMPVLLSRDKRTILWLIAVAVITFIIEALGVESGLIFGKYSYGSVLGPGIFGVPYSISLNWVTVIYGSIGIVLLFCRKPWAVLMISPILAVLFDFLLEYVAIVFNYWNWQGKEVPLRNYTAWWAVSVLSAVFFFVFKARVHGILPSAHFAIQFVYFFLLRLWFTAAASY